MLKIAEKPLCGFPFGTFESLRLINWFCFCSNFFLFFDWQEIAKKLNLFFGYVFDLL